MTRDGTVHTPCLWLLTVGMALLAGGCQDSMPTEARSVNVVPSASATQSWERSSFFSYDVVLIYCLGESVRAFGEVLFQYHEVTTSSEISSNHFQLARDAEPATLLHSGPVKRQAVPDKNGLPGNESFHLGPGEVASFVIVEMFVAEDGDRVVGKVRFHATVNANGELTVSRTDPESFRCVEK